MKLPAYINKGGPVNWILCGVLVLASILILERSFYFIFTRQRRGENPGAGKKIRSQAGRMKQRSVELHELDEASRNEVLEGWGALLCQEMEQGLWLLGFISNAAPSLGLLGTVTGLIKSFRGMARGGAQMSIQDFSGGIWEAMLTTAFGLIIAIPALFFYRFFHNLAGKRALAMSLAVLPSGFNGNGLEKGLDDFEGN